MITALRIPTRSYRGTSYCNMNPHDPSSFNHRVEHLSTGRTYHFVDQIPENDVNAPTLLLVHG